MQKEEHACACEIVVATYKNTTYAIKNVFKRAIGCMVGGNLCNLERRTRYTYKEAKKIRQLKGKQ